MLDQVPEGPPGEPDIIVTFDIDKNGILRMTCKDADELNAADVEIEVTKVSNKKEDIKEMIEKQKMFDDADQVVNNNVGAKNAFEQFCAEMR